MLTAEDYTNLTNHPIKNKARRTKQTTAGAVFSWIDSSDNEQRIKHVSLAVTNSALVVGIVLRFMS